MYEVEKRIEEYLGVENKNNILILVSGCEIFRGTKFEAAVVKTNLCCLGKYND